MLSNLQIRILKFLYPKKTVVENVLSEKFNLTCQEQAVKDLAVAKLIRLDSSRLYLPVRISLTETGRAYVENKRLENRRFRIPVILSIVAIIISVIAIIVSANTRFIVLPHTQRSICGSIRLTAKAMILTRREIRLTWNRNLNSLSSLQSRIISFISCLIYLMFSPSFYQR